MLVRELWVRRRAKTVMQALESLKVPEISARMGLCGGTVRHWLKRFNAHGLKGRIWHWPSVPAGGDVSGERAAHPARQGVHEC